MSSSVSVFLISVASLLMVGAIGEMIFSRTRIPAPLWLILIGASLRISGLVDGTALAEITPYFAAITLIIVLFDGGSRIRLSGLAKGSGRSALLATATFFTTMLVVALFSVGIAALGVLREWSFVHGLMLGSIVGGTSSLLIAPSLGLAGIHGRIRSLLTFEASITDALCAVFTIAFVDVLTTGSAGAGATLWTLTTNFGIAVGLGGLLGWGWIPALRLLRGSSYGYPCTLAALMLLYVLVDVAGGSPAMGVLAFSLVVGNARSFTLWLHDLSPENAGAAIQLDSDAQAVHSQIRFIVKSLFFAFLGLMMSPPWSLLVMGAVLGVILLLARIPAVFVGLRGAAMGPREVSLAYISMPRGMAAGALATLPLLAGVSGSESVPTLVFAAVTMSIILFTVGFGRAYGDGPLVVAETAETGEVGETEVAAAIVGETEVAVATVGETEATEVAVATAATVAETTEVASTERRVEAKPVVVREAAGEAEPIRASTPSEGGAADAAAEGNGDAGEGSAS